MSNKKPASERFHVTTCEVVNEIQAINSDILVDKSNIINPILLTLLGAFLRTYTTQEHYEELIEGFIGNTYDLWEQIRNEQEDFFLKESEKIFGGMVKKMFDNDKEGKLKGFQPDNIFKVKELFTATDKKGQKLVDKDDRGAVWVYLKSMVKICIKYVHEKREPTMKTIDGSRKAYYTKKFFPKVNTMKCSKLWDIDLVVADPTS